VAVYASYGTAIGFSSACYGQYGVAIGDTCSVVATNAVSIGDRAYTSGLGSFALGKQSRTHRSYQFAYSSGQFSSLGDAQTSMYVLRSDTTDATPEALTTDNSVAATDDQIVLTNNSAYSFSGTIIAREQASAGSDYASWEIKGALLRDATAASTVLGNGIQNKLYATSGASAWAIALTADTTNGGLKIEVTGAAATNIRWVATVNTSEVTY
ncbi:MAG: hypothetical protein MUQ60_11180, partial [Porticoccaceae bacterium]|nr:hypothetical protein [Porticoccaceae bacterium]